MRQTLYIHSASAISPQATFRRAEFLKPAIHTQNRQLTAIEAPYSAYISPVAIRKMSRIMKMAITAAMEALREAAVSSPDAIIIGTGRGGIRDMETMVADLVAFDEDAMNPTAFIQSTYNSPNGWIGMMSGAGCYNQTYVHRSSAFELAVQDAQMMAAEADKPVYLLVACYDELTDNHFLIREKQGYWKAEIADSAALYELNATGGSIAGEGAAAFVLSNVQGSAAAKITDMRIIQKDLCISSCIAEMLAGAALDPDQISFLMLGMNGDSALEALYESAINFFPEEIETGAYKHLCGEYETAAGFGLWLAHECIRTGFIPKKYF